MTQASSSDLVPQPSLDPDVAPPATEAAPPAPEAAAASLEAADEPETAPEDEHSAQSHSATSPAEIEAEGDAEALPTTATAQATAHDAPSGVDSDLKRPSEDTTSDAPDKVDDDDEDLGKKLPRPCVGAPLEAPTSAALHFGSLASRVRQLPLPLSSALSFHACVAMHLWHLCHLH